MAHTSHAEERPGSVKDVDLPGLRQELAQLPCCATNISGASNSDPLNIVAVGRGLDALSAFTGRGWRLDEPFDLHGICLISIAFVMVRSGRFWCELVARQMRFAPAAWTRFRIGLAPVQFHALSRA